MWFDPCGQNAGAEACNALNGLPAEVISEYGTDAPEGVITGYRIGGHFYFRTSTSKLYVFGGTPRTSTGWVILN